MNKTTEIQVENKKLIKIFEFFKELHSSNGFTSYRFLDTTMSKLAKQKMENFTAEYKQLRNGY